MPALIDVHADPLSGWVRLQFPKNDAIRKLIKEFPGTSWGPYQGVPPGPWKYGPYNYGRRQATCPDNARCFVDRALKAGHLPVFREWVDCKTDYHRAWYMPIHGWKIAKPILEKKGHRVTERWEPGRIVKIPPPLAKTLRPYQLEAAQTLAQSPGHLLAFDPRVGKTRTSIAAVCGLFVAKQIDIAITIYPAGVLGEWEDQLRDYANLNLEALQSMKLFPPEEIERLRAKRFLFVGCHYDILGSREADLGALVDGRRFALIVDEIQMAQNRRINRTQALQRLSRGLPLVKVGALPEEHVFGHGECVAVMALSGTPMRTKAANLWAAFDIMRPGSMGTYWRYAARYAGAFQDNAGRWDDSGETNPDELRSRLHAVWTRKTRRDVAPWLPKSQRSPIICEAQPDQLKRYRKLEREYGSRIARALGKEDPTGADRDVIATLARATTEMKIPAGIARMINVHAATGVKALGFSHHHETLHEMHRIALDLCKSLESKGLPFPDIFVAGGWMSPTERREVIAAWKAAPVNNGMGPILLLNSRSSGVGIDLSDALVTCFFEYEWVPADFRQAEDRTQDIHKGTHAGLARLYEYFMVRGTVDEAMILALLKRIGTIGRIVGLDDELKGMSDALQSAGIVDDGRLGLPNTDKDTIQAAIASIRARFLMEPEELDDTDTLAAEAAGLDDDDEPEDSPDDDDIPF
jgi:hypothetical protein